MVRTVISISEEDKAWLEQKAAEEGIPMTEVVRRAIRVMREKAEREHPPIKVLLERTRGMWNGGDGLDYQRRLRDEW